MGKKDSARARVVGAEFAAEAAAVGAVREDAGEAVAPSIFAGVTCISQSAPGAAPGAGRGPCDPPASGPPDCPRAARGAPRCAGRSDGRGRAALAAAVADALVCGGADIATPGGASIEPLAAGDVDDDAFQGAREARACAAEKRAYRGPAAGGAVRSAELPRRAERLEGAVARAVDPGRRGGEGGQARRFHEHHRRQHDPRQRALPARGRNRRAAGSRGSVTGAVLMTLARVWKVGGISKF